MKAMLLKKFAPIEQNPLELTDLPTPEPGPEEILVRNKVCGVCHTDLHTVEGELPEAKLPIVPGHQIVGVVEKAGEKVSRFKIGDRVGVAWLYLKDSLIRSPKNFPMRKPPLYSVQESSAIEPSV